MKQMDGENRFLFGCFLVSHVVGLYVFKIEKKQVIWLVCVNFTNFIRTFNSQLMQYLFSKTYSWVAASNLHYHVDD